MYMNSKEILAKLDAISKVKPKAKEEALKELLEDEHFLKVCIYAYDPFKTFGMKKVPNRNSGSSADFAFDDGDLIIWDVLDEMAERKLTGNDAKLAVLELMDSCCPDSAELLKRIINKDLRAGFTAKTINRVRPDTIFVFNCMLSHKYEEKRIKKWPVSVEPKYDGVRALCILKDRKAKFYSRTGKELNGLEHIERAIEISLGDHLASTGVLIDGEVIDPKGFNEIVGAVHRKDEESSSAIFMMFDSLPLAEFDVGRSTSTYERRREVLSWNYKRLIEPVIEHRKKLKLAPSYLASSNEEIEYFYQRVRDKGGEGVMVKDREGFYESKRSYNWLKIKDRQTVDIPIIGFEVGTGKNENRLGALLCDLEGIHVKVGGGITDVQRDDIWNNQDHYKGVMVEVEYHEKTPDGSLRHPRFIRFRTDKPIEDGVGV